MKTLDPDLAAHLASGATTLAYCWRIARGDGVVLGFTDHDLPLAFGGVSFHPANGLDGSETVARLGGQVDTGEVLGVLSAVVISEEDILLGRYDGAEVETWRVNWAAPDQRMLMRRDTIGEIVREDGLFRAELRSPAQALNLRQGRIYHGLCDAQLGDGRCGVNVETSGFRAEASVIGVRDGFHVELAGLEGFAAGWFSLGHAVWTSGRRAGVRDAILAHERALGIDLIGFRARAGDWATPGDELTLYAGCDRRLATCAGKFANAVNFRGFPHIPGNDYVLRHPRSGDPLDGRPVVR